MAKEILAYESVMDIQELSENQSKMVQLAGKSILICRYGNDIYAVQSECTHQKASLEGGRIRKCHIACPLHGVMFDLQTGQAKGQLTDTPLQTYPVKLEGNTIFVSIT